MLLYKQRECDYILSSPEKPGNESNRGLICWILKGNGVLQIIPYAHAMGNIHFISYVGFRGKKADAAVYTMALPLSCGLKVPLWFFSF